MDCTKYRCLHLEEHPYPAPKLSLALTDTSRDRVSPRSNSEKSPSLFTRNSPIEVQRRFPKATPIELQTPYTRESIRSSGSRLFATLIDFTYPDRLQPS